MNRFWRLNCAFTSFLFKVVLAGWLVIASDACSFAEGPSSSDQLPNIVLILSDDAGYSDFGFRGSQEIKTPNLDKLCSQSVEFTQAYAPAPVCTPSRAGLLTGRYPSMIGAEKNLRSKLYAHHLKRGLSTSNSTLAERLKDHGYATSLIGKWHLGYGGRYHPRRRGFDEFYGILAGSRDYFPMPPEEQNKEANKPHRVEHGGKIVPESDIDYLTDQLTTQAIHFMDQNHEQPFFLFLSYTAVHSPYQAKDEDIAMHGHMGDKRKKIGAMVSNLDQNVGRVMDAIDRLDLSENTLFIFTNDNGGTNEMNNLPYRGTKGSMFEGGLRVPFLARFPSRIKEGSSFDKVVSLIDLYPTCLAAAGIELETQKCDGVNLLDFLGTDLIPHDRLFFRFHSQAAIRKDNFKYYRNPKKKFEYLFDLKEDPYEKINLVEKNPAVLADLKSELDIWENQLPEQDW